MDRNICQEQNIIIRRYLRASHLRLRVNSRGQVCLTVPFFCPKKMALAFVAEHQDWIIQHQSRQKPALCFRDGMHLSIVGKSVQIRHFPNTRMTTHIDGDILCVGGDISFLNRRVSDFVRLKTLTYIQNRASLLATQIGQKVNHISLKDTTSRWGSCSGKKNLNFCWRLGLAPIFVLDYIIAHEVAHLLEMNHGPRFWQLVSQLTDRRADAEIWLRRHGHELR